MRLPVVPFIIAATLLSVAWYFFTATRPDHKTLDVPRLTRLADIDGIETDVDISPDGNRYAVVVSGDLWVLDMSAGGRRQMTFTSEQESFPCWTPDGRRITFTRGPDTFAIDAQTGIEQPLRRNATSLSWSINNRAAFVRDRALWVVNADGQNEQRIV